MSAIAASRSLIFNSGYSVDLDQIPAHDSSCIRRAALLLTPVQMSLMTTSPNERIVPQTSEFFSNDYDYFDDRNDLLLF